MGKCSWLTGLGLLTGFGLLTGCRGSVVVVAPGFDPVILEGRAGGAVDSGICGYIARRPNHRVQIREDLDYAKLLVTSPVHTTVLVKGSDGAFCGTPLPTRPAQISGYWQTGSYDIFIGSPSPNSFPNYQLLLTNER